MSRYQYKCFSCQTEYAPENIEGEGHYLCPRCGKAEKNRPLQGVLQIQYDYAHLKRSLSREDFLRNPVGEMWRYPELWPLEYEISEAGLRFPGIHPQQLERLALNGNPLLSYKTAMGNVLVFDDTRNPTLSYKDRASLLVALKALQMGIKEIAAASTGNAASSLAGICARLGLKAHLFVPENIPAAKRIQIQAYGASVYCVKGDYDTAFDLSMEISAANGWYNRNTAFNPLTIEGKKSAAYDLFIAGRGKMPDLIFVPVGDGVILSGIYKGLRELLRLEWIERMPRLVAVQASGSNALVRYLNTGEFDYRPAQTVADSILAGAPRNLFMAAHAVKESGGAALDVPDNEIMTAQQEISRETGLLVEPAAAAAWAGWKRLSQEGKTAAGEIPLLMFTGNGLKDLSALEKWNTPPLVRTPAEWKAALKVN